MLDELRDLVVRDEPFSWATPRREHEPPDAGRIHHRDRFSGSGTAIEHVHGARFLDQPNDLGQILARSASHRLRPRVNHARRAFC